MPITEVERKTVGKRWIVRVGRKLGNKCYEKACKSYSEAVQAEKDLRAKVENEVKSRIKQPEPDTPKGWGWT